LLCFAAVLSVFFFAARSLHAFTFSWFSVGFTALLLVDFLALTEDLVSESAETFLELFFQKPPLKGRTGQDFRMFCYSFFS